ncbi:MAG: PaaI family thioesterase [Solirubrobacterales bacterium]
MSDQRGPRLSGGDDLNATLGIEVSEVETGRVTGRMPVEDRVRQPFGIVHGGAYAAFAETLASLGTYRAVADDGKIALGMSNHCQFLRSVSAGAVHGEAIAIHRGSSTWVWDVTMTGDDGRVAAVSRLTIAVRDARAARPQA